MKSGYPYIVIEKEIQRVDRSALKALDSKDDIFEFPPVKEKGLWERRILLFSAHSR